MNAKRRRLCRTVGVGVATGTAALSATGASATVPSATEPTSSRGIDAAGPIEDLRIDAVSLPDEIVLGERFSASATVENTGSEPVTAEVTYTFETDLIASMDKEFDPGETVTVELPRMKSEWLERNGRDIESGTYRHGIGIRTGPRESADVSVVDSASDSPLVVAAVDLPDAIRRGESFAPSIRLENTGEEAVSTSATYEFDKQRVAEIGPESIDPGATERFTIPNVTPDMIETSVGRVEDGTHTHSFGSPDGPRESRPVAVGSDSDSDSDGGVSTATAADAEPSASTRDGADAARQSRGFFSNGGDGPEVLENAFNLTFAGFLLSVVGIVHQMIKG